MEHEDNFDHIAELSDPCWAALRAATGGAADRAREAAEKVFSMDLAFQTGREMRTAKAHELDRRFLKKLFDLGLFVLRYLSSFYLVAVAWFGFAYDADHYAHTLRVAACLAAASVCISLHAVFAPAVRARLCFVPPHGGLGMAVRALLHVRSAPSFLELARGEPRLAVFVLALAGELLFGSLFALVRRSPETASQNDWVAAGGVFLLVPLLDYGRAFLTPEAAEAMQKTATYTGTHFALTPRATSLDVTSATFVQDLVPDAVPIRRVSGARLGYSLVRMRELLGGKQAIKFIDFLFYVIFPLADEGAPPPPPAGASEGRGTPGPPADPESPLLGEHYVSPRAYNAALAVVAGPARPSTSLAPPRAPPRPAARLFFSCAEAAAAEAVLSAVERASSRPEVREQCGAVRAFLRAVGELDRAVAAATEGDVERRRDLRDVRVSALTLTLDRDRIARRSVPPLPSPHAVVI
eukprot:tig00000441_g711.t1